MATVVVAAREHQPEAMVSERSAHFTIF